MTKLRVHELAKELNISNNEIKAILGKNGIEIKSHMSAVDENMINIVKKACGTGTGKEVGGRKGGKDSTGKGSERDFCKRRA